MSAGILLLGVGYVDDCRPFAGKYCEAAQALIGVGALGYASGIIYDVVTATRAVDKYNQRHNLQVAPLVAPTTSGPAVGMGIAGSF